MRSLVSGMYTGIGDRLRGATNPVKFAESLGVQIHGKVKFYGISRSMFGSEPWLISLGNNVYVTAGVSFITHDGGALILRDEVPDLDWTAPISVGNDVYLGCRSTILPGVTIGSRCIIGAAAVVTRDVEPNSVVAGVPARRTSTVDEYLVRMRSRSTQLGDLSGDEKANRIRQHYGIALGRERRLGGNGE